MIKIKISKQIRNNAVALISLFVALSSLSYSTWRNEKTENNRNQRTAAFEVLLKLNELQEVIFYRVYENDTINKGNARTAWTYVLTIDDLSKLLKNPLPQSTQNLHHVWATYWSELNSNEQNIELILEAIKKVRIDALSLLKNLE